MEIKELYDLYRESGCVTTDSRDCPAGSIFIALRGDSFDGNRFAADALAKGCAVAVVDDAATREAYIAGGGDPSRMVLVTDTLQTYKELAREHRRQFAIPVVGITGTNGKTTTKELTNAVLAAKYNVMATDGNYNNDVGVPKTLMRLRPGHEIAIVEMGASHPGDIKTLVETAEPTCGLITNVGKAHLLGFGSLEGVLKTKGELYDYLGGRPGSVIFVNADNKLLAGILPPGVATVSYGRGDGCDVVGEVVACEPALRLRWRVAGGAWHEVATHLIGSYNLDNALAAVAVGLHHGVEPALIDDALAAYVPSNNRSQLTVTPYNSLVVDAYNANPTSMAAALDNFALIKAERKMAILGEMRELGDVSREEHESLVARLAGSDIDEVWLVGHEFDGIECPYRKFADVEQVKQAIAAGRPEGYTILIKGSNGNRLYTLPDLL